MSKRPDTIVRYHRMLALALLALAACSAGETTGPEPHPSTSSTGGPEPETPVNHAATDACTTFPQAGCPAEHTCVVTTAEGNTICESAGTAPPGSACGGDGDGDCALGLTCVASVCRPFCKAPSDCEGAASACFQVNLGMTPVPGWTTCSLPCNPADPRNVAGTEGLFACAAGKSCFSLDASIGPQGSTDCFPGGTATEGAACDTVDCGPGLVCLDDGGAKSCRPFCVMGLTSCTCLSFAEPFYAAISGDIKEVGYCQ